MFYRAAVIIGCIAVWAFVLPFVYMIEWHLGDQRTRLAAAPHLQESLKTKAWLNEPETIPRSKLEETKFAIETTLNPRGWLWLPDGFHNQTYATIGPPRIPSATVVPDHIPSDDSTIGQIAQYLTQQQFLARAAIEMETSLELDRPYLATLAIAGDDKTGASRPLQSLLAATPPPTVMERQVRVTQDVRARLSSADLKFTEQETGWKTIIDGTPTTWTWEVVAHEAGRKYLMFIQEQRVFFEDREVITPVDHFPYTVEVRAGSLAILRHSLTDTFGYLNTTVGFLSALFGVVAGTYGFWIWMRRSPPLPPMAKVSSSARGRKPPTRVH